MERGRSPVAMSAIPNSQATVANQVVAAFDTRNYGSTGDVPVTRFARNDRGNEDTVGTR